MSVKLTLAGAFTSGEMRIGAGASVTLALQGANAVGTLVVGDGASLSVSGTARWMRPAPPAAARSA